MTRFTRSLAGLAAISAVVALGACGTSPETGQMAAASRPVDCPTGTHICRHDGATAPTHSVSGAAMGAHGTGSVGGLDSDQMMNRGGGS